jgi:hypothetical protein
MNSLLHGGGEIRKNFSALNWGQVRPSRKGLTRSPDGQGNILGT